MHVCAILAILTLAFIFSFYNPNDSGILYLSSSQNVWIWIFSKIRIFLIHWNRINFFSLIFSFHENGFDPFSEPDRNFSQGGFQRSMNFCTLPCVFCSKKASILVSEGKFWQTLISLFYQKRYRRRSHFGLTHGI